MLIFGICFAIIYLVEIIQFSRKIYVDNYVSILLRIAIYKTPLSLHMMFPIFVGLAAMITMWQMSYFRELVVIRAQGISIWKILLPITVTAMLIGLGKLFILSPIESKLNIEYQKLDSQRKNDAFMLSGKGVWFLQKQEEHYFLISLKKINHIENKIHNVNITKVTKDGHFIEKIFADTGNFQRNYWLLTNVQLITQDGSIKKYNSYSFKTPYDLSKINQTIKQPSSISFYELRKFIRFIDKAGFQPIKYQIHYINLYAQPFLFIGFSLFAAIMGLQIPRKKQTLFPIIFFISGVILYYFLNRLFESQAQLGTITAEWAIFTPIVMLILLSISMIIHKEDG